MPGVSELGTKKRDGRKDQEAKRTLAGRGGGPAAGHRPRHLVAFRNEEHGDAKEEEMPDRLTQHRRATRNGRPRCGPVLERVGWPPLAQDFVPENGFVEPFQRARPDGPGVTSGAPTVSGDHESDGRRPVTWRKNGRLIVTSRARARELRKLWTKVGLPPGTSFSSSSSGRAQTPTAASSCASPSFNAATSSSRAHLRRCGHYAAARLERDRRDRQGRLAHCTCNGEVLVDAMPVPRHGPDGTGERRGQVEYRRIRVQEAS